MRQNYGSVRYSLVNIRNGPDYGCPVIGQAYQYDPVRYYCGYGGWTYLYDLYSGTTGWMRNEALHTSGGTPYCGFGLTHH
jgi:SH3-like domain-containing protein